MIVFKILFVVFIYFTILYISLKRSIRSDLTYLLLFLWSIPSARLVFEGNVLLVRIFVVVFFIVSAAIYMKLKK
ncbi:MAG: hypothetical protein CSB16_01805 [Clostridiales bacterium]|nr:MAG: hypothetical protein CSB16_01805 [Clostridiales bacterium]